MSVTVEECTEVTDDVVTAFATLIPQLSSSNAPPNRERLEQIVRHQGSTLFLARAEGRIVGSLTLAVFPIPTGVRAWIEDVVVDESVRGRGVGEALNRRALDRARALGAITVELTSRPSREAANRLYTKMGFVIRDTNIYRYTVETEVS